MALKLIFVYNAYGGLFNLLTDAVHKVMSPQTYACNLCAITFGPLGMRAEWKRFISSLGLPTEFLHRDELERIHGITGIDLPAVFLEEGSGPPRVWIDARSIKVAKTIDDLKTLIHDRLARSADEACR